MGTKTHPKSIKNRRKMDIKIDQNFACVLNGLLVALGANMAPKASQKPPGGGKRSPLGPSFGVLGPLGAKMAPRSPPDPPKMASGSNFQRFFIDFGRFLNDFLMKFSIILYYFLETSHIFNHKFRKAFNSFGFDLG